MNIEKVDMVSALSDTLLKIGKKSRNIVVLNTDCTRELGAEKFSKSFEARHVNLGFGIENMVGMAAGFSARGKIPFLISFPEMITARSWEQIRNSICYPNLNIKIIGVGSGLSAAHEGAGVQIFEDLSLMRVLPNMKVLSPADAVETSEMLEFMLKDYGPTYLRLSSGLFNRVFEKKAGFDLGKTNTIRKGSDVCLFATGIMVARSLEVADLLEEVGVSTRVVNVSSIKPIDQKGILKAIKKVRFAISVEEHNIQGGLGSAISELITSSMEPIPLKRIGLEDQFGESARFDDLNRKYGLDVENIFEKVRDFMRRA